MSEPPGAAVSLAEVPPAPTTPRPPAVRRVPTPRRPGRRIATAAVRVVVAHIVHGPATGPFHQWDRFRHRLARTTVLDGLLGTHEGAALSAVSALPGGVLPAPARLSGSRTGPGGGTARTRRSPRDAATDREQFPAHPARPTRAAPSAHRCPRRRAGSRCRR
ncbi:hypothetical protein AB0O68_08470 [Streptomyces sp. NPDC087512]|uniref:hypothetical protein n=1 Tax=Streptomyces sp. NPDC087512 TaxID=3155059 RepID=UPI003434A5DE